MPKSSLSLPKRLSKYKFRIKKLSNHVFIKHGKYSGEEMPTGTSLVAFRLISFYTEYYVHLKSEIRPQSEFEKCC